MDEHPFIELLENHEAAISRVCRSFCRNDEDREDLRQEILMNLWVGWKGYLLAAAAAKTGGDAPLDGFDLSKNTSLREQSTHLKTLITMLPPCDQRLINHYLDGFSSEEICRLNGRPAAANCSVRCSVLVQ